MKIRTYIRPADVAGEAPHEYAAAHLHRGNDISCAVPVTVHRDINGEPYIELEEEPTAKDPL